MYNFLSFHRTIIHEFIFIYVNTDSFMKRLRVRKTEHRENEDIAR